MSEQRAAYTVTASANLPIKIEYTNDKPDLRSWLTCLRRDLLHKVKQIDELLAAMPVDKT